MVSFSIGVSWLGDEVTLLLIEGSWSEPCLVPEYAHVRSHRRQLLLRLLRARLLPPAGHGQKSPFVPWLVRQTKQFWEPLYYDFCCVIVANRPLIAPKNFGTIHFNKY